MMRGDVRVVKAYVAVGLAGLSCAHGGADEEGVGGSGGSDGDSGGLVQLEAKRRRPVGVRAWLYIWGTAGVRSGQQRERFEGDQQIEVSKRFAQTPATLRTRKRDECGRRFAVCRP